MEIDASTQKIISELLGKVVTDVASFTAEEHSSTRAQRVIASLKDVLTALQEPEVEPETGLELVDVDGAFYQALIDDDMQTAMQIIASHANGDAKNKWFLASNPSVRTECVVAHLQPGGTNVLHNKMLKDDEISLFQDPGTLARIHRAVYEGRTLDEAIDSVKKLY